MMKLRVRIYHEEVSDMSYVYFTEEQKERANSIDLVDFLQRQGEKMLPSGRDKRLSSDHSITVRGNSWYDHAIEKGGLAIDFVKYFYGKTYPENRGFHTFRVKNRRRNHLHHFRFRQRIVICAGPLPTC